MRCATRIDCAGFSSGEVWAERQGTAATSRTWDWPDVCSTLGQEVNTMAQLDTKKRDRLRSSQFAYVDSDGGEHLPINDASHVRNAIARFNQTEFESVAAKERARKKIVAAAKRHDVEVADDSAVAHPARSLKATRTKRGLRGGRKD